MRKLTALTFVLVMLGAFPAAAEEEAPPPPSYFTVMVSGGWMMPSGDMADASESGLEVGGRLGWTATSGLGFVASVEWAPSLNAAEGPPDADSQLVSLTAGPRFTLGYGVARPWASLGGGAVIFLSSAEGAESETRFVGNGLIGLDLHFFSNGGLSLTGSYSSNFDDLSFFAATAGLVFSL